MKAIILDNDVNCEMCGETVDFDEIKYLVSHEDMSCLYVCKQCYDESIEFYS